MAQVIKTLEELENILRSVVLKIFKLNKKDSSNRVIFPYSNMLYKKNTPHFIAEEDTCVIYILPKEDDYNKQKNVSYRDDGGEDLIRIEEHTDVHMCKFDNYGNNAYECARSIRDGILLPEIVRILKENNLFVDLNIPAIKRETKEIGRELYNNVVIEISINEYVRLEQKEISIKSVNVECKQEKTHIFLL